MAMVAALAAAPFLPVLGAEAGGSVSVALPGFPVTLNGTKVNNDYSKYPLIVYKNITYFPMTYSDCRFLGLESDWKGNTAGLSVNATGVTAAYQPYQTSVKNGKSYTAKIPGFPIQVNGKAVDNSREEYPLLSFRDVTYFPMTWKYGAGEFGWDYSFDNQKGLVIDSDNIKLEQTRISSDRAKTEEGKLNNTVTAANGYVYYEGTKGRIMQAPLSDTSKIKTVYQLPIWTYGDGKTYVWPSLYTQKGKAMLFYHQGGATMGTEYLIQLNDDGSAAELNDSRYVFNTFGDKTFSYWAGPFPSPGNLSMKAGDSEFRPVGNPDYIYGWAWRLYEDGGSGGGGVDTVYLIGDDLYILGFPLAEARSEELAGTRADHLTTGIYKINIDTNETVRISERPVYTFQKEGNSLYYPSEGAVYKMSLEDGKEELVARLTADPSHVGDLQVLNGNIYWENTENRNLYRVGQETSLNPGAALDSVMRGMAGEDGIELAGSQNEYLICTFEETADSRYRIMIFDKNGGVVFKTSDRAYAKNITIEGKTLYFYNITTGTVCTGRLK